MPAKSLPVLRAALRPRVSAHVYWACAQQASISKETEAQEMVQTLREIVQKDVARLRTELAQVGGGGGGGLAAEGIGARMPQSVCVAENHGYAGCCRFNHHSSFCSTPCHVHG